MGRQCKERYAIIGTRKPTSVKAADASLDVAGVSSVGGTCQFVAASSGVRANSF